MRIDLKALTLLNFKGIKELTVPFGPVTNISGDNGTGKTTIFDAFTWLLFGKDSHDSKDFQVKTLDGNNQAIPMIDHTVTGEFNVNGTDLTLGRNYREKWTRRRGVEQSELTGHETAFFIDGVPVQAKDYQAKVSSLVDEGMFKLLTSATYFNSMPWKERRSILVKIAGDVKSDEIISTLQKQQSDDVMAILSAGKKFDDERAVLTARKKKLSDELSQIPSRIDEVRRGIPEPVDFEKIELQLKDAVDKLDVVNSMITDQVEAHKLITSEMQEKQNHIHTLKMRLSQRVFGYTQVERDRYNVARVAYDKAVSEYNRQKSSFNQAQSEISGIQEQIRLIDEGLIGLRKSWDDVNSQQIVFDEDQFTCPTCGRELDPDVIQSRKAEMVQGFASNKAKALARINSEGVSASGKKKLLEERLSELVSITDPVNGIPVEPVMLNVSEDSMPGYKELSSEIAALEVQVLEVLSLDIQGMRDEAAAISREIDSLKTILMNKSLIEKGNARVNELLADEKNFAQQVADIERVMFAMECYTKSYMDQVEKRVNGKFAIARWKMFNVQLNGGIEPTCECLVSGVPYSDINSASKIQVGIDCINTLGCEFGIFCPVWVDNRESTNILPETDCQLINLYVTKDPKLVLG